MSAKSQVTSGDGEERLGLLADRSTARSIDRSIVLLIFSIERRLPVLVSVSLAAQVLNSASGSGSGARASPSVHTHETKAQAKVVIKARRSLVPGKTLTIVRLTGWVEDPTGFVFFFVSSCFFCLYEGALHTHAPPKPHPCRRPQALSNRPHAGAAPPPILLPPPA